MKAAWTASRAGEVYPAAAAVFATLNRQKPFAVLYRVADAKRPQTRARRVETLVAMLAKGGASSYP